MLEMNYRAVVVAAVAWFVVGALWYSPLLFGKVWMELRGMNPDALADMKMPVGEILGEFVRGLIVAFVLARFVVLLGVADWKGALLLGVWLWIGFHATLLVGAVLHEGMPWKVYAIHAGDGLAKIPLMAVILGLWR